MSGELAVPDLDPDVDTLTAALAYAAAGWFVGPTRLDDKDKGRNPGSVLGNGWPTKTSRDPETIIGWFAGTSRGVFLHAGRSGAVVLDVDHPDQLPDVLTEVFATTPAPYQASRDDIPGRGHHVYRIPPGRQFGNGTGKLGVGWGNVRGANGVVVAAPTPHAKPGGWYRWVRIGSVPELPVPVAAALPDIGAGDAADAAADGEVAAFLVRHTAGDRPGLLAAVVDWAGERMVPGARHDTAVAALCWALREAQAGFYPACEAVTALQSRFLAAIAGERRDPEEWRGMVAWAIGQAALDDPARRRGDVEVRLDSSTPPTVEEMFARCVSGGTANDVPDVVESDPSGDVPPVDVSAPTEDGIVVELQKLRTRDEAKRRLRLLTEDRPPIPRSVALGVFLTESASKPAWRVKRLMPAGSRVILSAQRKAGKSTLLGNLLRSFADDVPFLGQFEPVSHGRRLVLIDDELDEDTLRRWLGDHSMVNHDRVTVWPLRGQARSLDVLDAARRREWAARLRDLDAGTVILDCLRPVLDALDLDEDHDVGRFFSGWEELLAEAEVTDNILAHHQGHNAQRSRGSSRLRDWPDVEWRLQRDDPDDDASPRSFIAYGRDVDVPPLRLDYDPSCRALTVARSEQWKAAEVVAEEVAANPGVKIGGVIAALQCELGSRDKVRAAVNLAETNLLIYSQRGPKNQRRLYPVITGRGPE